MKFSCSAKMLAASIGAAAKIVNPATAVPILHNALLAAKGDTLTVQSTDLETTFEQNVVAEVIEAGSSSLPARLVADYLAKLGNGDVVVTADSEKNLVLIECEKSHASFNTLPADEYPKPPREKPGDVHFHIAGKDLHDAVNETTFAASRDQSRMSLTTTLLELHGAQMRIVATDGYRLAHNARTVDVDNRDVQYMVPSKALNEVGRHAASVPTVEVVALGAKGNHLRFVAGDTSVTVRLFDGKYPEYEKVIPQEHGSRATVKVDDFVRALRRAQLISDVGNGVNCHFEGTDLTLTVSNAARGEAREVVMCEVQGPPLTLCLNAQLLIDALTHIADETVTVLLSGAFSPVVLKTGNDAEIHVVMPLRIAA